MRTAVILIITIAALVGAFFLFSGRPDRHVAADASNSAATPAGPVIIALTLRGGKLAEGPAATRIEQGTKVTLRVTSDLADAMHLHGYDLHLPLEAGKPAELTFVAATTGRFEYELHEHHALLGAIEVYPR